MTKKNLLNPEETVAVCACVRTFVSVCSCQPYRSSLGGRLSLLSAPHVSQANVLIHSAYLPSICLHYNHSRIIGFLLCSQIGTFIPESFLVLHLKLPRRQARTLHDTHTPCPLSALEKQKPPLSCGEGELVERTERRGGNRGDQTVSAPNQIVLHCCVKFQMTSKDVWEVGCSRAGSMTGET